MKNKKVNLFMAVLLVGAFAVVATMGSAIDVNAKSDKASDSSKKTTVKKEVKKEVVKVETRSKAEKKQEFKTYETAAVTSDKGNGNAQLHQKKITEVTTELDAAGEVIEADPTVMKKNGKAPNVNKKTTAAAALVAAQEEGAEVEGEVGEQEEQEPEEVLEEVAEAQEEMVEETTEAIEEVESRGKVKKLFLGSDYKNLGALRSDLVHNRNDIRKLTRVMATVQDPELAAQMDENLTVMMQERERIRVVIADNEEGFSLFGWVGRFMNGYQDDGIEDWDETEESLADIVVDAIEEADEAVEEAEEAEESAEEAAQEAAEDEEDGTEADDTEGVDDDTTTTGDDDATEEGAADEGETTEDDATPETDTTTEEDPTAGDDTTGTGDPVEPVL